MGDPSLSVYKGFIDALVALTPSLAAKLVREERRLTKASLDPLVSRLSPEDREGLAEALEWERYGAIHDVLAHLTWLLDRGDVRWSAGDAELPAGVEGGLHLDYVGRLNGWEWPSE